MSYDKQLAFAKDMAYEAGAIMKRYFRAEDIGTEWKQDNTPLTVADTTINRLFITKSKQAFPDYGVLGEEESYETGRDTRWIIDPIDGTMPFSLGMPWSTFAVALSDQQTGESLLAVVYDPYLDHLYHAVKGGGAFLNGIRIHTSKATGLKNNYLSISEGRQDPGGYEPVKCGRLLRQKGARSFAILSSVYIATRVAGGELVGAISNHAWPWDIAAAALIVQEAGGLVTDLDGQPRRFDADGNYILAANKRIQAELLAAVKKTRV